MLIFSMVARRKDTLAPAADVLAIIPAYRCRTPCAPPGEVRYCAGECGLPATVAVRWREFDYADVKASILRRMDAARRRLLMIYKESFYKERVGRHVYAILLLMRVSVFFFKYGCAADNTAIHDDALGTLLPVNTTSRRDSFLLYAAQSNRRRPPFADIVDAVGA